MRGVPYYFRDGIWYRNRGRGFVVVRAPIGAFVTVLPGFYTTERALAACLEARGYSEK